MIRRNVVTRSEWRWVLVWICVALIITSLPYAVGALRSTPEQVFSGFVIAVEDGNLYLAKMNQGAQGAWLFHLPYTSEPHLGTLFHVFYLLLGKAAAITALPPISLFHLTRVISAALFLVVLYRFIAMFVASRAARRLAFLLITFSGGLGWLLILIGQPNWLDSAPIDLISPEAFSFLTIYAFPHIALARMLLLLGLMLMWSDRPPHARRVLGAAVCWSLMGLLVPMDVGVADAVLGIGLVADAIVSRRIDWPSVRRAIAVVLLTAPVPLYSFAVFQLDPILAVWLEQSVLSSPSPLHYGAAYLLMGILAVIGLRHNSRPEIRSPKLIGWLIIIPILIYVPVSFQRRLFESWQVPLGIVAAIGLVYRVLPAWSHSRLVRWLASHRRYTVHGLRQWVVAALLIVSSLTYSLMLSNHIVFMLNQMPPGFRTGGEIAALDWLVQHTMAADVLLSSEYTGNFLPTRTAARTFLGHGPETAYSEEKRVLVAEFYAAATSDQARQAFLQTWPITYVVYGPPEKKLGQIDLSRLTNLTLVYDQREYQIYRVER
ncbi:MAG: hypothetical protein KA765_00260 [Thermoflexales bacterium]|nr:hypothetical protein [Thermoflexales bacterium]